TGNLGRARTGLADIVEQVRRRADILEQTAVDYRLQANRAEALAAATPIADLDTAPSDPAPVPHGVR
ncbi:MAG: hypothetical protein AAGA90_15205, partial [Actinomycetota bacterium]